MIERAVILAAGLGLRLKPLTNGAPKCLTEINGTPILFNALRNLSALGIVECTLVVGYLSPVVRETVGSRFEGIRLEYIENEQYRSTNDMYSLWLARRIVEQGAIILEGDIFFRAATLTRALDQAQGRSCYLVGSYDGTANEILVLTDSHMRILSVEVLHVRQVRPGNNYYMSSGMLLIQPEYGTCLSRWLSRSVEAGRVDVLFDQIISEHVADEPLYAVAIDHGDWVEIDTPQDLAQAEQVFR
jgi:choline kinase